MSAMIRPGSLRCLVRNLRKGKAQRLLVPAVCSLLPCDCGKPVEIYVSADNTRTEAKSFGIYCPKCGQVADELPSKCTGGKRAAIAEWNREQRMKKAANAKLTPLPVAVDVERNQKEQ